MPGAIAEVWRDTEHLVTGTQKGSGTTITDRGKDFKSCGVYAGLAVRNITQSTSGNVVSATEDAVVTDVSFAAGETYKIYMTATYNSKIATLYLDRRAARKVTDPSQVVNGILIEDEDLDEHESNVWGPGQPMRDK